MSSNNEIETICVKLKSTKVTERKRASEVLLRVLKDKENIEYLNRGGERLWTNVLVSVHNYLRKEADKAVLDSKKKGIPVEVDGSIFYETVEIILKEGGYYVENILQCIKSCLNDEEQSEYCSVSYLRTLHAVMLSEEIVRGYIKPKDWDEMYNYLKRGVTAEPQLDWRHLQQYIEGLSLFFKFGPLHGLSSDLLKDDFSFVTELCEKVSKNCPRRKQFLIMEIVYNFCCHTAKDNRISCCKLGEDTFSYLILLYEVENPKSDGLKMLLIKYILLQVVLHNPNGLPEEHPRACTFSWEKWLPRLKFIYKKCKEDLIYIIKFGSYIKNPLILRDKYHQYMDLDFTRLIAEVTKQIQVNFVRNERQSGEHSNEIGLNPPVMEIIDYIDNVHHWPWINVLCTLIEMHPAVIDEESFIKLLQLLSKLQIDCKDDSVAYHIYYCLALLLDMQEQFQVDVKNIWTLICDTALRTFGLKQNNPHLHRLLEKLIMHSDYLSSESILNTFSSQVLDVTENNLRTLETLFNVCSISRSVPQIERLIDWIVAKNNFEDPWFLSNTITAKVLVGLIAKKWPYSVANIDIKAHKTGDFLHSIADICLKNVFEISILECSNDGISSNLGPNIKSVPLDYALCSYMVTSLKKLIKNVHRCLDENNKLFCCFNIIALLKNIISYLLHYKLIQLTDLYQNNVFLAMIKPLFKEVTNRLDKIKSQKLCYSKITNLNDCITSLHHMFLNCFDPSFEMLFRQKIPTDLLKSIVSFLYLDTKEEEADCSDFKLSMHSLRITVIKTLVGYSSGARQFSDNETFMFSALAEFDYSLNEYTNCDLALTFFRSIKECRNKIQNSSRIEAILNLLHQLCETKYKYYSIASEILEFLYDLFPHLATDGTEDLQKQTLKILRLFYDERDNYGPKFFVNLINCIGKLYQVDPECKFSKWENCNAVILKLPEFICHKYQEVRFAALENLVSFFKISSSRRNLADYHLQEIMFADICAKCETIFEIGECPSAERFLDETMARSAIIFHALSSIFCVSTLWQEECLFAVFKIIHTRGIVTFPKALKMISQSLNIKNSIVLLEKYLTPLLTLWVNDGQKLDDFPISLFRCGNNKIRFYKKYTSQVVPFLLEHDAECLNQISKHSEESVINILEKCFPSICMNIITSNITTLNQNIFESSYSGRYLNKHFRAEEFKSLFLKKIDEIILNLLSIVKDEEDFCNKFAVSIIFTKSVANVTIEVLREVFALIEGIVCPGQQLVSFLYIDHVDKLQRIIMQLVLNIYDSISEADKLKAFHQYTIINEQILENLNQSQSKHYFIRETCYVLLRFIKNYIKHPELAKLALIHFKCCLTHLVHYSDILGKHFVHVVTTLMDNVIEKKNVIIADLSLNLLKFLIIDNTKRFEEIIKHMVNFPEDPALKELYNIQSKLKNSDRKTNLEDVIFNFVNLGSISKNCLSKVDSLARLQLHLFCKKRQLKSLYSRLSDLNGFSEDCGKSLLHQLISLLVELSISKDENISLQALKCLGELGPSDLMTLVVKPEKRLSYLNSTPFEFFSGQIISLLNMYLVESDVELIQPSVELLYIVLNTEEGRKVIDSNEDFGFGSIASEYLFPFLIVQRPKSCVLKVNADQLVFKIDSEEFWCPSIAAEYQEWIRVLVCNILETVTDSYIPQLINICRLKVEFCEILLPSLVYLLISQNNIKINRVITQQINSFFKKHWNAMTETVRPTENLIVANKKAIQVMMNVVHFVRVNKSNMKLKKNMEMLDLDYLKIAKAAQHCSAYFTSLLYIELWCHSKKEMINNKATSFKCSILDFIQETESEDISLAVVNILRSSYKAIGDNDSLQGCGSSFLMNTPLQIEYYKDIGMWECVLLGNNIQTSRGVPNAKHVLMESYKLCGLFETSLLCKQQEDAPDYECMWRLSNWSLPDVKFKENEDFTNFEQQMEKYKYFALKNVYERDNAGVLDHIRNARGFIKNKLKHASLESSSNLYHVLMYLQGFNEIENFLNTDNIEDLELVVRKWNQQDEIHKNNFSYIEPVITQRMIVLNDYVSNSKSDEENFYKNHLLDLSLNLSERARVENKTHFGIRALSMVQNLPNLSVDEKTRICLEDAQLCKATNNMLRGMRILNKISGDTNVNPRLRSLALKLTGEWSVESYSENANTIIRDYFLASLHLAETGEAETNTLAKSKVETYNTLAKFADREYQQVTAHINSDIFQKKMKNMQKSIKTVNQLSRKSSLSIDEKKAKIFHERQSSIDQAEIENIKREKENFLKIALSFYLRNLFHSEENNLQIFRVMALFLENRSCEFVKELINEHIPKIPSYKFLVILPQLIPHIADKGTEDYFSEQANLIIDRCAKEHPHHTLPILMALANSHKDFEYDKTKTRLTINEERVLVAKQMIKALKKNPELVDIITQLETVSDALIELAYLAPNAKSKKIEIPWCKISRIKDFSSVPVLTDSIPVNKNGKYDNIVGIHKYEKYYELVGGLNAPKKILCIGTDGKPREQLLKGQDDLRQDAVMQQVFTIMNSLLSVNKQTRDLKIRTYKVVPLSRRSGILEWAKNTMPVGAYLTGDGKIQGAHQRYRPRDKSPGSCQKLIEDAAKRKNEQRLEVFNNICENFKPVFHKFFEENFLHPSVWYERRRAYIHSVATSSMCGYILGIGDRHVSNILIDKTTAEVIHIDFGIAFEQGRTLPMPETVPFRLTRDFVDAMGISGVEGAFRRSCEKTMSVMRENHQTLMAIVGVLLYDPSYSWTVSPAEACKRQSSLNNCGTLPHRCETDPSVNYTAERALLRLNAKLCGIAEGTPMSVERQVGVLIHQAMDPANLCKIFHGWQAYL